MNLVTILVIILILVLVGVFPAWPHSANWGHGPASVIGVILLVLIVLLIMGRL